MDEWQVKEDTNLHERIKNNDLYFRGIVTPYSKIQF